MNINNSTTVFRLLLLLLILFSYITSIDTSLLQSYYNNTSEHNDISLFLMNLMDFSKTIFTIEEMSPISNCIDSLYSNETFKAVYQASGKELGDPGFESNCLKEQNLTYHLMIYSLTKDAFSDRNDWEIISFLRREKNFMTGLCVTEDCLSVIPILQTSTAFHSFLKETGIVDLRINTTDILPATNKGDYIPYKILLWSLIVLFILMLLAFVFSYFMSIEIIQTRKSNKGLLYSIFNDNSSRDEEITINSSSTLIPNPVGNSLHEEEDSEMSSTQDNLLTSTVGKPIDDEKLTKSNILKVLHFFSFAKNASYLFQPSNLWFNESSLEFLSVCRFLFLFLISFNHSFYTFQKMIQEDFFNINIYTTALFGVVKASIYAIEFSIVIDAFIMSYKLMWYLKRNCYDKDVNVSIKIIASFSLLIIPKIITFILEYYLVLLFSPNMACEINSTPYRLFYHDTVSIGNKQCEKHPWLIFIPFYLQYIDYTSMNKSSYSTCFRYTLIYQNELICCIIFLLLIYIMNKLRSKLFDYCIGGIIVLGICLSVLDFELLEGKATDYDLNFYLGQTITLKYTHMFFPIYMLGAFAGVIYFYHKDSISSKPMTFSVNEYYPFEFCFRIMKLIHNIGSITCYIIKIFWWVILILLSSTFYFYRIWYTSNHKEDYTQLVVPVNTFQFILYYYDRHIIVMLFLSYLLIQFIKSKHIFINYLGAFKLMMVVSRVSFSALLCADTLIYIFLIGYDFDSMMGFSDCLVLTIGVLFVNIFISLFLTIVIEMPVRVLSKIIMRKCLYKESDNERIRKSMQFDSLMPIL